MSEWISVKDQMPRLREPILYAYRANGSWLMGIAQSQDANPEFTHWMPVPQLPARPQA